MASLLEYHGPYSIEMTHELPRPFIRPAPRSVPPPTYTHPLENMPTTKTKTRKNRRRWILICVALIVLFIVVFIPVYNLTSSSKVLAPSHLNTSYSGTKVTTFPSNYSIQSSTPTNGVQHSKNLYQTTSIHTNTITPIVSASTPNSYHPTISPTRQTPNISPVKTLPTYNHSMNASERSVFHIRPFSGYYHGMECDFQKQFRCGNGICMSHKHWCNNVRDCSDGSDELPGCQCLGTQFHCKLSGECIPGESYCDGHALCQDLTDEPHNCTCNPKWHIECANHRCLPKSFKCDGINQCGDFSDEVNCTCFGSDYKCKNGMCLPIMKVCNGQPDCADGDDESSDCTCREGQFRCNSGQCVLSTDRCNGLQNCLDQSDEMNCDCKGFQCDSGLCLWGPHYRCNEIVDCKDLSDEMNCHQKPRHRRCRNGIQVKLSQWCDGQDNCFDNSDEENCHCIHNREIQCGNHNPSICIPRTWECDGFPDCPNGTDEMYCESAACRAGEFRCHTGTACVSYSSLCDGVTDCNDNSDEENCVKLMDHSSDSSNTSHVWVTYENKGMLICCTKWSGNLSNDLCGLLGYSNTGAQMTCDVSNSKKTDKYLRLKRWTSSIDDVTPKSLLDNFKIDNSCTPHGTLKLLCPKKVCGKRPYFDDRVQLEPYLIGADIAKTGEWPWMASLRRLGEMSCSAALLNQQWLITAGHCISKNLKLPFHVDVTLGSTKQGMVIPLNGIRRRAIKVITHPLLKDDDVHTLHYDIGLIKMEKPIPYTPTIQPICLPPSPTVWRRILNHRNSTCHLAGWGAITQGSHMAVRKLRTLKMHIWSDAICSKINDIQSLNINMNSTFCAGYRSILKSGCKGDSGSPLSCQDRDGRWYLIGIMSAGNRDCRPTRGTRTLVNFFTRVDSVMQWIQKTIGEEWT
ncbi:atrial natriuretic peptide-converting enzyme-like isoform X3 [Octopus sinensis]|uniref:Atrial natriuretic peptide-converting enzyme-like isoform X3 n=1 Tax=Octopus sinensis TaxID=2607531 RepID=A0A7E6EUM1_9MOLL|nr:atrial natriuretic peptide-converting enzyme-like isoform X3 [Octopus sinensis]